MFRDKKRDNVKVCFIYRVCSIERISMSTKDKVSKLLLMARNVELWFTTNGYDSKACDGLNELLLSNKNINSYIVKDDKVILKLGPNNKRVEIDKDGYISGEDIGNYIGLSRVSVWKAINSLEEEGYEISKKRNKGYRIENLNNLSSFKYKVKSKISTEFIGDELIYLETVDSTNTYLSKVASSKKEGTVVISKEQTKGKGRIGRTWESKLGGIYISVLLKPQIEMGKVSFITQIAAAALVCALKDLGVQLSIKWPNDIVLNNKKIAGILTEMSAEIDRLNYVIVGLGINHTQTVFEEEIKDKATSIFNEGFDIDDVSLVSRFLESFEEMYKAYIDGEKNKVLDIIRNNSAVIGREIYLISDKRNFVRVMDIDDEGYLVVKFLDGSQRIEKIFTGEVSLRGKDRYI